MSYQATVLKVMLASPSDVATERRVARDVIHEWNDVNAEDRRFVLLPIGWESHTYPQMGERPQEIINKQILRACDILVAIFWTRLGTPTGVADSGTVEEIEEHLAAGKPVLIYFSSVPVVPGSYDPLQWEALQSFKTTLRERGLIEEYAEIGEFRDKFARQLAQMVIAESRHGSTGAEVRVLNQPPRPDFSQAGWELLAEASKDPNGAILSIRTMGGAEVQSNGRGFAERGNPRSEAKWHGAVDELERLRLVEDRAGKGEVFYVTNQGYETIERFAPTQR